MHLLSVCSELTDGIVGPGVYDFRAFDEQMRKIIDINPHALVMPRVGLIPTQEWLDANPRERMVHFDLETNKMIARGGAHVSFNSPKWHAMMEPALREFILHVERHFGENVAGYHVAGGDCGEWSYIWAERLSDFSEPQQEAYRWWLAERYKTNAALQEAWGDPQATLAGAQVPRDRLRPPGAGSILDPVKDRRISDYLEFHSDTVARRIERFAEVAKDALREAGRTKIVAAFYGYHFWFSRFTTGYHDSGHHALARVLACPHVDPICAPGACGCTESFSTTRTTRERSCRPRTRPGDAARTCPAPSASSSGTSAAR
ncbi:MAG: beta-galactosidase [Planctomycetota bacterium]|nr:beta-galactosidase [Planctomycetota bacterium]